MCLRSQTLPAYRPTDLPTSTKVQPMWNPRPQSQATQTHFQISCADTNITRQNDIRNQSVIAVKDRRSSRSRMPSSGMLRFVALVRTDVSDERSTSLIRVTRLGEFVFLRSVARLLVPVNVPSSPIFVTLNMEALSSSETSVLTRATWRNIPEDGNLHSYRRENLKSYIGPVQMFHVMCQHLGQWYVTMNKKMDAGRSYCHVTLRTNKQNTRWTYIQIKRIMADVFCYRNLYHI
jgi:hypothetical protein